VVINHAYYSELCSVAAAAFAVSGQISHAECNDLLQHLPDCAECQELMRNFVLVSFEILPARTASHSPAGSASSGGLQKLSFPPPSLARSVTVESTAVGLGKTPRRSKLGSVGRWTAVASAAILIIIIIVVATTIAFQRSRLMHSPQGQRNNGNRQIDSLVMKPATRSLLEENAGLKSDLQVVKTHETALTHERQEYVDAIAAAQHREAELTARVAALENANTGRGSELAQLRQDLESVRSERDASQNVATLARIELADRSTELKRVSAQLSNATRFIATLSEAQDLIEGRDVHVWTAHYADENGKQQQAYARILYEEGRKLVFYAFDLPDRSTVDTQLSFIVWGEKSGTHSPKKNLGTLHIDDSQKGRWKLRFEDPNVLAQIDRVFVTAEVSSSNTVGTEPKGQRMISSSLKIKTDNP
jgi:hypothetical protein